MNPRFINIDTTTPLENIKFSYSPSNDYYVTYDNLIARQGTPDINFNDYAVIPSLGSFYTHGQFILGSRFVDNYQYTGNIYGVQWDSSDPSPECTRIGNLSLHATLPVQSQMVGGVMTDDGTFTPFQNQSDWTSETRDGSTGQVMVKIPQYWCKFVTEGTILKVLLSAVPVVGFKLIPEMYVSAYEAALDRTNLKLASVVNNSTQFRGGNNTASWDSTYRDLLGRPASNLSLTNFRTYARNRNKIDGNPDTRWNCMLYEVQRSLYWLYVTEYATLNTQKPYNAEPTGEGFRQGGLGVGVSEWEESAWNSFNGYNPFVPCGYTDEFGNLTGVKNYEVKNASNTVLYTAKVPRYRGIENPFGHIWQWTDGILVNVTASTSPIYLCSDPAMFSSTSYEDYTHIGDEYRGLNFVKEIHFGENGDITAKAGIGSSTSYYCDYHYTNTNTNSLRGVLFGGGAGGGAYAGLVYSYSNNVPSDSYPAFGSRLCFKP